MRPRRAFLQGLVSLPLIGGGVTLIGEPTAAATPVTTELLDSYDVWLDLERSWLRWERYGSIDAKVRCLAEVEAVFRSRRTGKLFDHSAIDDRNQRFDHDAPLPSHRAAVVLGAVGCDWRRT